MSSNITLIIMRHAFQADPWESRWQSRKSRKSPSVEPTSHLNRVQLALYDSAPEHGVVRVGSSKHSRWLSLSCLITRCYENWFVSLKNTTGWRRLIGSPKLQIIFHKRATKYRALLLKMTYKDKATDDSTPPCTLIPCNKMYVSHQSENRGPWQKTACWTLRYREVFALQQTATDRNRLQHTY